QLHERRRNRVRCGPQTDCCPRETGAKRRWLSPLAVVSIFASLPSTYECLGALFMSIVPNHRERQLMQQLRGRGWVKAFELPPSTRSVDGLLRKGWIEVQGEGRGRVYRITEEGMRAKTALIPLAKRSCAHRL